MQHLIDFIHEHTLDEQVYLVLRVATGDLELNWNRRKDGHEWRVRPKPLVGQAASAAAAWQHVHKDLLVDHLRNRGASIKTLENELRAIVMTQIVFADMVLCDARKALGRDAVRRAVLSHRDFVGELNSALRRLTPRPTMRERLSIIPGEGKCTEARTGHLSLVV